MSDEKEANGIETDSSAKDVEQEQEQANSAVNQSGFASNLPARLVDNLPTTLPILISPMGPVFPGMVTPLPIADKRSQATLKHPTSPIFGVVAVRPQAEITDEPIDVRMLYEVGCAGRVVQQIKLPDGKPGVILMSTRRLRVKRFIKSDDLLLAEVEYPPEVIRDQLEVEALHRRARQSFSELAKLSPEVPDDFGKMLEEIGEAGSFADFVAFNMGKDVDSKQALLASFELDSRLRAVLLIIEKELDLAKLGAKLREEIRTKIESRQKEHYLREQLQAIRKELGEELDQREMDKQLYEEKIAEAKMPELAEKRARSELERLLLLPSEASEYHVIRNYLDWLVDLPWSKLSPETMNIGHAAQILDKDHHGLKEVKERIIEFLAVRKLKPEEQGAIICLVGPPGVGKTSLGKSVARAMGREFFRVSLGGMRDEAEIKGHRRTYVGAMPGKIIQGLRRVGTRNPVFMLDELDKLSSDWRGDPSSALLEALDPAQNSAFDDLYIDLPFDLSQVMFIATANMASQIPVPLLDRMEVISLSGYIPQEKLAIARKYLLPRQLEAHGLKSEHLKIQPTALGAMVDQYTREAGVRELERTIGRVCRKVAARVADVKNHKKVQQVVIKPSNLKDYLGPQKYHAEIFKRSRRPGVVIGLAWTPVGGEILFIEATSMPGKGGLRITGKLGSVMNESAQIALSLLRSRAKDFHIPEEIFKEKEFHLHVPSGAVPKDGPSAGVAMTCALLSLMWKGKGKPAKSRVAMTGEITLRGTVLPVGGIKEKVVGAKRAGIKTIILPKDNLVDVEEIAEEVKHGLSFIHVEEIEEAIQAALGT